MEILVCIPAFVALYYAVRFAHRIHKNQYSLVKYDSQFVKGSVRAQLGMFCMSNTIEAYRATLKHSKTKF